MLIYLQRLYAWARQAKIKRYMAHLESKGLFIGHDTKILEPFFIDPDHCFLIRIEGNCTLAPNVRLIAHDASTKRCLGYTRIGRITIHEGCFIGDSTIILPNTSIGPNSIVGAGSVVNKSVPPGVVAAGNPVRVICALDEYIERIADRARSRGVYGKEYRIDEITPFLVQEVLGSLADGEGYII